MHFIILFLVANRKI